MWDNVLCVIQADLAWNQSDMPFQAPHTQKPQYGVFAARRQPPCIAPPPPCHTVSHNIQNRPESRQEHTLCHTKQSYTAVACSNKQSYRANSHTPPLPTPPCLRQQNDPTRTDVFHNCRFGACSASWFRAVCLSCAESHSPASNIANVRYVEKENIFKTIFKNVSYSLTTTHPPVTENKRYQYDEYQAEEIYNAWALCHYKSR